MKGLTGISLFLTFALHCGVLSAEQYYFNKYNTSDGLPSNTIYRIAQDRQGFIWISTRDGICRYDGKNFHRVGLDRRDEAMSTMTPALCVDDDGLIWFASEKTVGSYDPITGEVTYIGQVGNRNINDIVNDNSNNIWIISDELYRYNKNAKQLLKYDREKYFSPSSATVDSFGSVWLTSQSGTLYRYDNRRDIFEPQDITGLGRLASASDGLILAATTSKDVLLIDTQSLSSEYIYKNSPQKDARTIMCLMERRPGEYWIGTEIGIFVYKAKEGIVAHIQESIMDRHAISASYVMHMFTDREGNVWAGTFYTGVNLWQNKRDSYSLFFDDYSGTSLRGKIVRTIVSDSNGYIWVGTEDGYLNRYDSRTKTMEAYPDRDKFFNIQDILADGAYLWLATYGNGLVKYNPATKSIVKSYNLSSGMVIRQKLTRNGDILVGTYQGLSRYDRIRDTFEEIPELKGHFVHAIMQDSRGYIWIGTYGTGIWVLSEDLKVISHVTASDKNSGLSNDIVSSFLEDSKHRIWVTTQGGGICMTEESTPIDNLCFTAIDKSDGLPSNVTCAMAEDLNGMLWISTASGLTQMDPISLKFTSSYFEESQITGNQYSYGASYTSPNGTVYFGTTDGMIAFSPALLESLISDSEVYISGIYASTSENTTSLHTPGHSALTSNYIEVKYKDISTLEVHFAAPHYSSVLVTQYAYSLKNGKDVISGVTKENKAVFNNIDPGRYTFTVRIVGDDRDEAAKSFNIRIKPPVLQTTAARVLYVLAVLSLILATASMFSKRRKAIRARHLARLETEKEKEIYDAKIKYFTNITHEIRTPLSLIKMPVDKIIATNGFKESARDDIMTIQSNTQRLLDLTNQLLDLRKMEQNELKLNYMREDICALLTKSCDYFASSAKERRIDMDVHVPDHPVNIMCASDSIQKILTNLISNAIKYGRNTIDISLEENTPEAYVSIRVNSNGDIIAEQDRERIFEPFFQIKMSNDQMTGSKGTGLGLPYAKTLAGLHNGRLYYDSNVTDVNSFVLELPVEQPDQVGIASAAKFQTAEDISFDIDSSKHSLLIVEDSVEMRNYLSKELSGLYNILSAGNGEEAMNIIQGQKVDLVISDIMMPVMDGCELCNIIKTDVDFCHIPVILLTAAVGVETRIETLKVGADGYIEKPFSIDLLKANVDNLFKNKEISFKQFTEAPLSHYNGVTVSSIDKEFMDKLHAEVMKHLSEQDLNIEVLTNILGTSKSTLYRKIKANTGLNINEYIRLCRLKEAAEMLSSQKYRINEVAYLVGFSSPSYFTTSFQKQFNISPSAFVKHIKQDE